MVQLDQKEKKLVKMLLDNELKTFEEEEGKITPDLRLLEIEERYDLFLKKLLKKLE